MTPEQEQIWRKECRAFMQTLPGYARSGFSTKQAELVYIAARKAAQVEAENGYNETWIDEGVSLDDIKQRLFLMHTWVKQHQYAVNNANKIKNEALEKLKSLEQENESLRKDLELFIKCSCEPIPAIDWCPHCTWNDNHKETARADKAESQLKEREEMIREAIPWITDSVFPNYKNADQRIWGKETEEIKNWLEKANKITKGEG